MTSLLTNKHYAIFLGLVGLGILIIIVNEILYQVMNCPTISIGCNPLDILPLFLIAFVVAILFGYIVKAVGSADDE